MQQNPSMKIACDLISDNLLRNYSLDITGIHGVETNIMRRNNNILVFTDPVSMD